MIFIHSWALYYNPLTMVAISKLLEMIDRSTCILACSIKSALKSYINQNAGSGGHLSMFNNRRMHTTVCLLHAEQPKHNTAKSGEFIGELSWVVHDPITVKGLIFMVYNIIV